MKCGDRVVLNTLLREGEFPGEIVALESHGLCVVKLDCQETLVRNVVYYECPPEIVQSSFWQICYPKMCGEQQCVS